MIRLLVLLLLSSPVFGQTADTVLRKYDQAFLYRYGSSFMKGGTKLSFGNLEDEFTPSSLSFDLYRKSKNNKTISTVLRLVSLAAIYGVVRGARNNNTNLSYGVLAGQLAAALGSQYFHNKATIELDRAIQIRNRELLFPGR
ncbi:MAG: hypothetical protein JWP69_2129 [Flaviaesturariibacter sp.]|nr:hypothetical protein [Flaviaesturariibacter sp.]